MITANVIDTVTLFDVLETLEKTTGTNDKIAILAKHKGVPHLRKFLYLAMDERVTFGISKLPDYELLPGGVLWSTFSRLCERLELRELTGNAAKAEIIDILEHATPLENKWYRKCLQKDLSSIGIGASLVNKAFESKFILDFKCSGASPEAKIKKMKYPASVELKINGFRTFWFTDADGKVTYSTFCTDKLPVGRSGLPIENFAFLNPFIEALGLPNRVFDGEVVCDHNLEEVQSLFNFDLTKTEDDFRGKSGKVGKGWTDYQKRKAEVEDIIKRTTFVMFECLDRDQFENEAVKGKYKERRAKLEFEIPLALASANPVNGEEVYNRISIVDAISVKNEKEAYEVAQSFMNQGLEGGVVKDHDGEYGFTKDNSQVKIKIKTGEVDCKIVGWEQAKTSYMTDGTPYPAMLGKLIVEYRNDRDEVKRSGVGTGKLLTRQFKLDFAANPENYINRMCVCTSQEFTKDEGVMSCPRVEYLRPVQDKNKV